MSQTGCSVSQIRKTFSEFSGESEDSDFESSHDEKDDWDEKDDVNQVDWPLELFQ